MLLIYNDKKKFQSPDKKIKKEKKKKEKKEKKKKKKSESSDEDWTIPGASFLQSWIPDSPWLYVKPVLRVALTSMLTTADFFL